MNYAAFIYFALWPTRELIEYLRPEIMDVIALDLDQVPFIGGCIKVSSHLLLLSLRKLGVDNLRREGAGSQSFACFRLETAEKKTLHKVHSLSGKRS